MDGIAPKPPILLPVGGICTYIIFIFLVASKQDPREPPNAPSGIPIIGHVIGLMRSKFNYYVQLSHQSIAPIFTMAMPGQKMYIVTTPDLIQDIQKRPKTLAFPPIEAKFATTVCGASAEAHNILLKNVNGDEGDWGLSMDSYSAMRAALLPGPGLDEMNRLMIQNVAASLDSLIPTGKKSTTMKLSAWLRRTVTAATTNSVYGPQNPFKDPEIEDCFWQFEHDLMSILVGILPSVMARKGLAARAKVAAAFEAYFKNKGHEQSSMLMKNRYEASAKNGVSVVDIARYEVGGAIALLVNTAPAVFWMVLLLFAEPELLQDIRKEVEAIMETTTDQDGKTIRSLDITNVKTNCPLLTSAFQESLRYRTMGTSVRQVMEDTVLDGKWLLKKDAMVQMPSRVIHTDASIWGEDVNTFNARRFMKDTISKTPNGKRPNPTAFRAFGGGTTLCPGRHFATNEILAVVSMFVVRFDMKSVSGSWALPKTDHTNVAAVVMEPDTDIEVEVSPRKGFEEGRWAFGLRDSKMIFAVVHEDQEV
ncbi:cytochrome P450 [Tricladium varicosporioides]|nr:cytochrome P450 [Hymenoscyphus varicosporioides]